jgi:hypothetical protein
MNFIPGNPLPDDRLTRAERRRTNRPDAEVEGFIASLRYLAKAAHELGQRHPNLPRVDTAVAFIEQAGDEFKVASDYLEAGYEA